MAENQTSPTRSITVPETEIVMGSNMFVIRGYSLAKSIGVGNHIASEEFTVGRYKWVIMFYPQGKSNKDDSDFISVFIALASEARDVRAKFELTLMDQSGQGKHEVKSCFKRFPPRRLKCRGRTWGYKHFLRRDMLESSGYLRDDCLKIYYTVGVVGSTVDCSRLQSIQVSDSDIRSHISMILENTKGWDIILNVHAHKLIFTSRSPKLQSELVGGVDTEKVEVMVPDTEAKVSKALLQFMSRDTFAVNELVASSSCSAPLVGDTLNAKLLAAADRKDSKRLKVICETHLSKDISVNSVTQVLALADRCHAAELKDACLKFAAENLSAVMNSDGSEYIKQNYPSLLLNTVAACDEDCSNDGGKSLLNTVDGCDEGCSNDGGMSESVGAELSHGGDDSGRRVKQRVEEAETKC